MALERLRASLAGRYRLERELGQGGMATVYLAQDLKHDRQVAIKVLRPELAAVIGAERFLREIKTIANLQHPHILGLIDSGEVDGTAYYVMPFVEGESLRDRLSREKQLPIADAVRIATEVGSALDYAHRHGVIHRDIKPENILLHDGQALVADFGIALAVSSAGGTRMTETGMSLGTPHYMSPEQAMGERTLDARTDVYALGCVLYEMLTGDPPFTGSTAQAIVAKVMTEKPVPPSRSRDTVPEAVEDAVLTALAKLPADRYASAAEFAAALEGTGTGPRRATGTRRTARATVARFAWPVAAAAALALAAWGWLRPHGIARAEDTTRAELVLPDSAPVEFIGEATIGVGQTAIAISNDGRTLAYVGGGGNRPRMYVRPLDRFEVTPLAGTGGAFHPFFSPDGAWIGFFADNQLRKVATSGGPVTTLAEVSQTTGGVWARTGDILYTGEFSQSALARISASGGQAVQLNPKTPMGCTKTMSLLPDDRWILCTSFSDQGSSFMLAYALESGEQRVLVRAGEARPWQFGQPLPDDVLIGTTPLYRNDGSLLYTRPDGTLLSLRFDPDRLMTSGEPAVVATGIRQESWSQQAQVATARNGTIAYIAGSDARLGVLAWLDRYGRVDTLPFPAANSMGTDVSPNGAQVVVSIPAVSGALELWLYDLRSGNRSRLLTNLSSSESRWTSDGRYVIAGLMGGVLIRVDPTRPGQQDTLARTSVLPFALSRDDRFLLGSPGQGARVGESLLNTYRITLDGSLPPEVVTLGGQAGGAYGPTLSPDDRWVAYLGHAGGVFVEPYPPTGEIYRISGQLDGDVPYWSAKGDEIFFPSNSQMYVTRVHPGSPPRFDPPQLLAAQRFANYAGRPYAVAPDGQRFLIKIPSGEHSARSIRVILNARSERGAQMP
jgi:Tol biopolymer transport system component/tRNA A-37 threonylcarbamoyl transferase component Bud32